MRKMFCEIEDNNAYVTGLVIGLNVIMYMKTLRQHVNASQMLSIIIKIEDLSCGRGFKCVLCGSKR